MKKLILALAVLLSLAAPVSANEILGGFELWKCNAPGNLDYSGSDYYFWRVESRDQNGQYVFSNALALRFYYNQFRRSGWFQIRDNDVDGWPSVCVDGFVLVTWDPTKG